MDAGEVRHWNADVNGVSIHVAERGPEDGPAVLLLHGFPELWLSWRHQMAALAARGFRALAPDLRGYGDSSAPSDPAAYSIFHIVGDVVALLDHLQLTKVFVVGHDWGAQVAWHLCLFRPDRVRAAVVLGVAYFARQARPITEVFAAFGDGFYINQFQEPGRAESAFARYDVATVLKKFYSITIDDLSAPPGVEIIDFLEASPSPLPWISEEELGQYAEKFQKSGFTGPLNYYRMSEMNLQLLREAEPGRAERAFARYDVATVLKKFYALEIDELIAPPGVEIIDFLQAPSSPIPWLTEKELGQYAKKFEKTGFTGPLNYYRMLETNWRLTAPWSGSKITVPAKFILSKNDVGLQSFGTEEYVKSGGLKENVPDLEVSIIEGHHFVQQEKAETVNSEILVFLDKFPSEGGSA